MQDTAYASANVRIRVYENNLLTRGHYERMLSASNFEEAVNILKDTPYRNDVDFVKETKKYDELLMNEFHMAYEDLFSFVPQPELVEISSLRYSYHNLKVLFKEEYTGNDFSSLLIPIGRYPVAELRQAIHSGKSDVLDPEYIDSIQEVKQELDEYHNVQAVDIILDRRYFTHLKILAQKIGHPKVMEIVEYYIDLNNLSTVSRAIKQQRTQNFLTTILSSSGSIPKKELVELGKEDLVTAGKILSETKYRSIIERSIDSETKELDPVKVDLETDDAYMKKMQDARLQAFGPLPTLGYLYAKEIEVKNIRLVLAGKENGLPAEQIRERMRLNYGT
ncbi:V-type ATPase subunit [Lacticigenium naphthae]|uniref:V-type ATPase subunit n=1 Tax=Lacticigenium naphthae TaxID=515351 RepID=UPI0003FC6480|nr:V-type ATPase subunit [Lacticigenium naphthae]